MAVDIQATGFVGLAFEATAGTFTAPTKFFPIRSESLQYNQDTQWRRNIRGIADVQGAILGPARVEGDIEMECLPDVAAYFLHATRNNVVKTGTGPYIYTATPYHGALPVAARTLSITIVRNGIAQAYTGCVVGSQTFTVDNHVLVQTVSLLGREEVTTTVPVAPAYSTTPPFGHGSYTVENPTGTTVLDTDTFSLQIEDNAAHEHRLSTTVGAAFARFGERAVTLSATRDYENRTEFDTFKALTARGVKITASTGANNKIEMTMPAAIKDSYNISGLSSQGDLVRAEITYQGVYDPGTSKSYELKITSSESIV